MPAPANLSHETSTSTGTGNLTVAAVNGKQRLSTAFGTGGTNVFDYFISHQDAAEWERGTGHMVDANTLARDTVIESTNGGAAVDFSAGTKDITNDIPALSQARGTAFTDNAIVRGDTSASGSLVQTSGVTIDDSNNVAIPGTLTVSGQTNFNASAPSASFADAGGRLSALRVYTTTGNTWSKPAGLGFIVVECIGAGAGGTGVGTTNINGGGGGAGGYCIRKIAAASLGATETVTVGTGGGGGATGGNAGTAGGASSFGTTPFCTACGGSPGTTGGGWLGGCGGASTSGDINAKGGPGGAGLRIGPTAGAQNWGMAGWGGQSFFGAGGRNQAGPTGSILIGIAGDNYGAGGGGGLCVVAASGAAGGAGAGGAVIVWEYL